MHWMDVCIVYPAQWLVIELLDPGDDVRTGGARPGLDDRIAVIELCADGCAARHRAAQLRRAHPGQRYCFLHTSYPSLAFDPPRRSAELGSSLEPHG
jgi:hypothetical protein